MLPLSKTSRKYTEKLCMKLSSPPNISLLYIVASTSVLSYFVSRLFNSGYCIDIPYLARGASHDHIISAMDRIIGVLHHSNSYL